MEKAVKPFYNSTEAELASGAANVVAIVTPVPGDYGVDATIMTNYGTLTDSFTDLLTQSENPGTRTPVVIGQKNIAKKLLRSASIDLARIFISTPAVTNPQLVELRMNERVTPQDRPVPPDAPKVDIDSVSGRIANIRVHDVTPDSRGLAFGARGAFLYTFVGNSAPASPSLYTFQGLTTRAKAQIAFPDSVSSGAVIWISACWVGRGGETSVASEPISFTLQGGLIGAAA